MMVRVSERAFSKNVNLGGIAGVCSSCPMSGTGVVFFMSMLRNKAVGSGPSIAARNQIKAQKPNGGNNHEKDKHHP